MVSVILPVYNTEKYLAEAVGSVLSQTYADWELIAVDDGSTDGSGRLLDELASRDPRIHVYHTENRGLSAARNFGLGKMSGSVVQFLDSDDWLAPAALEETAAALKDPDVDMVIFDAFYTGMGMNFHEKQAVPPGIYDSRYILEELSRPGIPPYAWNKPCRSKLYRGVEFPEGEKWEDVATTFYPVSRAKKIAVLGKPLYYYRQREDAITKKAAADHSIYRWRFLQYRRRYEFLKKNDPSIADAARLSVLKNGLFYYGYEGGSLSGKARRELYDYLCSREFMSGITEKKMSAVYFVFRRFPRMAAVLIRIWERSLV